MVDVAMECKEVTDKDARPIGEGGKEERTEQVTKTEQFTKRETGLVCNKTRTLEFLRVYDSMHNISKYLYPNPFEFLASVKCLELRTLQRKGIPTILGMFAMEHQVP